MPSNDLLEMGKVTLVAFVRFFYTDLCLFICLLKELETEQAKSHWLHLFGFFPLCVFKCFLKLPACEDAKSHWLHLKRWEEGRKRLGKVGKFVKGKKRK